MVGRMAAASLLILLAGCAGVESAGRNAQANAPEPAARTAPQLPPPRTALPAPPAQTLPPPQGAPAQSALPPPAQTTAPQVAANVAAPPPPRPSPARDDDEIVVPGVIDRQIPPPNGDPRTASERMSDINAWDRCVTRVQASFESDPTRPQLDTPEEACSRSLGMANREAVPDSRIQRRR